MRAGAKTVFRSDPKSINQRISEGQRYKNSTAFIVRSHEQIGRDRLTDSRDLEIILPGEIKRKRTCADRVGIHQRGSDIDIECTDRLLPCPLGDATDVDLVEAADIDGDLTYANRLS